MHMHLSVCVCNSVCVRMCVTVCVGGGGHGRGGMGGEELLLFGGKIVLVGGRGYDCLGGQVITHHWRGGGIYHCFERRSPFSF